MLRPTERKRHMVYTLTRSYCGKSMQWVNRTRTRKHVNCKDCKLVLKAEDRVGRTFVVGATHSVTKAKEILGAPRVKNTTSAKR